MDLPAEYMLHLLPLMAICGIPPPQAQQSAPIDKRPQRKTSTEQLTSPGGSVIRPPPALASIPYIDKELGQAILKLIDQWRTLALWEPLASRQRQVLGASLEGIFRVIPVDRVCFCNWTNGPDCRAFDCLRKRRDLAVTRFPNGTGKRIRHYPR